MRWPSVTGVADACVTVLSSNGTSILLSTYIGGSGNEKGEGIAVQSDGSLIISGYTPSDDFPVSSNAHQSTLSGMNDAFLYHIDPTGVPPITTTTNTTQTSSDESETPFDGSSVLVLVAFAGVIVVILSIVIWKRR